MEKTIKLVVVGDAYVGKTRYVINKPVPRARPSKSRTWSELARAEPRDVDGKDRNNGKDR